MNIYNEDAIFLTKESSKELLSSLLFDEHSIMLRDEFLADIKDDISFLDNGDIILEVPDIIWDDNASSASVNTVEKRQIETKEITIVSNDMVVGTVYYSNVDVQIYDRTSNGSSKYYVQKRSHDFSNKVSTKTLKYAS